MEEDEGYIGCMSCMSTNNLCELFSVYSDNDETYAKMFETCYNIKIPNDLKYVCTDCVQRLEEAVALKTQTVNSIVMLQGVRDEEYLDESLLEEDDITVIEKFEQRNSGIVDEGKDKDNHDAQKCQKPPQRDQYECDLCGVVFHTSTACAEHLERCHSVSGDEADSRQYACHFCDNVYSGRKACYTHVRMKHGLKLSCESAPKPVHRERKFCHICRKDFSQKQILNKHLWKEHGYEVEKRKAYVCPLCDERVSYGSHFERHLLDAHRFQQRVRKLQFRNMDEFILYKSQIQEETKCRFRKTTASKPTIEGLRSHYMCSQSGMYVYQGRGIRPAPERQIYKTGKACPAHMVLTETVDRVYLTFYMTHVGHGACPFYEPRDMKKPKIETSRMQLLPISNETEDIEAEEVDDAIPTCTAPALSSASFRDFILMSYSN